MNLTDDQIRRTVPNITAELANVRADLDDAAGNLGVVWTVADHDAITRLTNASEALLRATATLANALDRIASLPGVDA